MKAESFAVEGGWCVNKQFMDLMGSPYLLAHGMPEKGIGKSGFLNNQRYNNGGTLDEIPMVR